MTIENGDSVVGIVGVIGEDQGSTGAAIVKGKGSSWTLSGELDVGLLGTGTLTVQDGGSVKNTNGIIAQGRSSSTEGRQIRSFGTATVTGQGSTWTNSGNLTVGGDNGSGTLVIQDGGIVTNTTGYLGDNNHTGQVSTGTATVTGQGSTWTNTSDLFVGRHGTGALTIQNGGVVKNARGIIGGDVVAAGTVTVTGQGSTWFNSDELNVGYGGTGKLAIQNGGTVTVKLDGTGTVYIARGISSPEAVLAIGALPDQAPTSPGTLQAAAVNFGSSLSKLVFNHTGNPDGSAVTFAPTIKGNGHVEQVAGTTILTGTNTYSGGTVLAGGTLQVAKDANLGTDFLAFKGGTLATTTSFTTNRDVYINTGGGTFAPATGTTLTVTSDIKDSGPLTVAGPGTVVFTTAKSFEGATRVTGGTLALADNGRLRLSSGLALATTGTFDISKLIDTGTEITGLSDTAVGQAGTVALGSKTLTLSRASGSFGGNITGSGGLNLTGGTQVLTGRGNTYTGDTTVGAGTLQVDGALTASKVTVKNLGILAGSGSVGESRIGFGGTLAPGSSSAIGTLSINGPLTFAQGSFYTVKVTPSANDRTTVTGPVTIEGGTVQVRAGEGTYTPNLRYTLISATGGITGQFSSLQTSTNLAFLTPSLSYDNNTISLGFAQTKPITDGATTGNQGSVGGSLNQTSPGGSSTGGSQGTSNSGSQGTSNSGSQGTSNSGSQGTPSPASQVATAVLNQTTSGATQALSLLSGEAQATAVGVVAQNAAVVQSALLDHLRFGPSERLGSETALAGRFVPGTVLPASYAADLPGKLAPPSLIAVAPANAAPNVALWGQALGVFGGTRGDGNAARVTRETGGFVVGAETGFGALTLPGLDSLRVGVAVGTSWTGFDIPARLASGQVETVFGSIYGRANFGPLQLRAGGIYGSDALDTRRGIRFPGFSQSVSGKSGSDTLQGFGEIGYRIAVGAGFVEPFVGGGALRIARNAFAEAGGAAALQVFGRNYDIQTATAGVQGAAVVSDALGLTLPVSIQGSVGYRRAFGDVVPQSLVAFTGGQPFGATGTPIDRDALVASAGVQAQVARDLTLGLAYAGQVGARASDHQVRGNLTLNW
ncbi:autotransporter domain-containing protein [Methylobacterium sp. JK268]